MLHEQKGFTLIELMICIFIIGLFAGIVIPNYIRATHEKEVDRAAKQLAADFRDMRQRSADDGDIFGVKIDDSSYSIINNSGTVLGPVEFDSALVKFTPKKITFNANDLSSNLKANIVVSSPDQQYKRYIKIAGATGRVRISKADDSQEGD